MNIGVVGLGYVGLAHAAAFASYGFNVVGVEVDRRRIETIKRNELAGSLGAVVGKVLGDKLQVTDDYGELRDVDLVFCL